MLKSKLQNSLVQPLPCDRGSARAFRSTRAFPSRARKQAVSGVLQVALKSLVTGIFLTAFVLLGSQEKSAPSDEKGKAVAEKICASCHEMDIVTASRRTEIGWRRNVEDMVSRGAEGSDQELAEVVRYLTKNFGKLNVNTATAQQLQEFLGLSEKEAQAITAWRDRKGSFKDFDQLKAVPDVDGAKLQEKRSLVAFSL